MASSMGHTGVYGALSDYDDNNAWLICFGCVMSFFAFKMVVMRNSQRTSPLYTRDRDTTTRGCMWDLVANLVFLQSIETLD